MRNKYGAIKVRKDGYVFDSKAEYNHYLLLKDRLKKREITALTIHNRFPIVINGTKICDVLDDFGYYEKGQQIHIDVKGVDTSMSKLKRKLVKACYPCINWIVKSV